MKIEFCGEHFTAPQPLAQGVLAFLHRRLQATNGAIGNFSSCYKFRNGCAQRLLVRLKKTELLVEPNAIQNREQQKDRDHGLDQETVMVAHGTSNGVVVVVSSAFSNMANVVRGFRSDFPTRTATRSPTRPMRPSVIVMSPQRTVTIASGLISSISVSPTLSSIMRRNGSRASYSTASTPICACPISVARWPSQIGSRPNFSPMNICSNTARIGSIVAYGSSNSMVPPRASM